MLTLKCRNGSTGLGISDGSLSYNKKKTNSIFIFTMDSDPVHKAIGICFPFIYQPYYNHFENKMWSKILPGSTAGGISGRLTSKNNYKIL